jgi:hypothetical protein
MEKVPLSGLPFHNRQALPIGASISPAAISICIQLGIKNIALVGQDLAFEPITMESHANLIVKMPKSPILDPKFGHDVEGNELPLVRTSTIWSNFAASIENLVDVYNLNCTNTSRLGRKLKHCTYKHFETWLRETHQSPKRPTLPSTGNFCLDESQATLKYLKRCLNSVKQLPLDKDPGFYMADPYFGRLAYDCLCRLYVIALNAVQSSAPNAQDSIAAFMRGVRHTQFELTGMITQCIKELEEKSDALL